MIDNVEVFAIVAGLVAVVYIVKEALNEREENE